MAGERSSFSQQLRHLREAAGLTQAELAERAGISVKAVSALESGRRQRPYPSTVRALADALELSDDDRILLSRTIPGRSAQSTPTAPPSNLPAAPAAIIGREREIDEIIALLDSEHTRLVTLTGPGGVGKTRLALEAASRLLDAYAGRLTFISLGGVSSTSLAMPEIAHVLGVAEVPDVPAGQRIAAHIGRRSWLLVIDNVEHVLDIATEFASLLSMCPGLNVIATSRAPLRIRAEHEYVVRPLTLPDLSQVPLIASVAESSAVQLFVDRARATAPHFELTQANCAAVAAICRRLDGLPLALELVAARIRALSPTELLARLEHTLPLLTGGSRDLPQRQQTMQAAIDWSYQLLTSDEQALFRILSIFQGGWMLDAAEHLSASSESIRYNVIELLSNLVEQSLIITESSADGVTRYQMLETIREYAVRCHDEAGESSQLADLHLDWCISLATAAGPGLHGPDQHQWLLRLDEEHDNLRAALTWSQLDSKRKPLALRLTSSLWLFWETRGHLIEGRRWLDQALAGSDDQPAGLRADALNAAGNLAYDQGDHDRAAAFHTESMQLRREMGDELGTATSLLNLGNVVMDQGDYDRASELYAEALQLFREHGSPWDIAHAVNNLGIVLGSRGEYDQAIALLEEAIALREPAAEAVYQARSIDALGEVMRKKGDLAKARELHEQSLALRRARGDSRGAAVSLRNLGLTALYQGQIDEARGLIEESMEISRTIENRKGIALCLGALARIERERGNDELSEQLYLDALRLHHQLGINDGVADIFLGLAALRLRRQQPAEAAWLLGASDMARETMGQVVAAIDRSNYAVIVASIRGAQPADTFERARESGLALTIKEAVAMAVQHGKASVHQEQ